jgi:hypothetical protein
MPQVSLVTPEGIWKYPTIIIWSINRTRLYPELGRFWNGVTALRLNTPASRCSKRAVRACFLWQDEIVYVPFIQSNWQRHFALQGMSRGLYAFVAANLSNHVWMFKLYIFDQGCETGSHQTWERPVSYALQQPGNNQELEFLPYKSTTSQRPTRIIVSWLTYLQSDHPETPQVRDFPRERYDHLQLSNPQT